MAPAKVSSAQAEVILLAISLGKYVLAERSHRLEAVRRRYIQKPDRDWEIDSHAAIGAIRLPRKL